MTLARSSLINLANTPYYHLVSRCVRRAYLCGSDSVSGQSFEHRRGWIINEINTLLRLFTLHISAYSIMQNHYHLVVCIDKPAALALSDKQVALQWQQRFNLPVIVQHWLNDQPLSNPEQRLVKQFIRRWRARLYDISWFMRCLNESIARRANLEDKCKGRFWEGRFKSQALLDDKALLQCMAYVDLNPVRAGLARTPETSRYTAIRQRIFNHQGQPLPKPAIALMPMGGKDTGGPAPSIPFKFEDYLNLVDWSGRAGREDLGPPSDTCTIPGWCHRLLAWPGSRRADCRGISSRTGLSCRTPAPGGWAEATCRRGRKPFRTGHWHRNSPVQPYHPRYSRRCWRPGASR